MADLPVRLIVRLSALALSLSLLVATSAAARPTQIALLETDEKGRGKQMTLLGYAAAPPALTRELVADPLRYPRYVRNMTRSTVEKRTDGVLLNKWKLSYPIGSFEGEDAVRWVPGSPGSATGAVEISTIGEGKEGISRWEFFAHPDGGTLVVVYGYFDPLDNKFVRLLIGDNPALDAGFNLAGALALLRGLIDRAGREASEFQFAVQAPLEAPSPDFSPLLARGTLAIVRSDGRGALVDVSVVERIPSSVERLEQLVRTPEHLPRMMRMVKRVEITQRDAKGLDYEMTVDAPLLEVVTTMRTLFVPGGADSLAISGPAKGARFRWDLRADKDATIAVWRGNLHLSEASRLMRAMLRIEPSFEHGASLTVGLMSIRALATLDQAARAK
jgi:hypothetical protein